MLLQGQLVFLSYILNGNLMPHGLWRPRESEHVAELQAPVVRPGEALLPGSSGSNRRSLLSIWWGQALVQQCAVRTEGGRELPGIWTDSPGSKEQSRGEVVGKAKVEGVPQRTSPTVFLSSVPRELSAREPGDVKAPRVGW